MVYDFAGPYHIGVDDLAFGSAMRYLQLDPAKARRREGQTAQQAWDSAVDAGSDVYCTRMHNIWCVIADEAAGRQVSCALRPAFLCPPHPPTPYQSCSCDNCHSHVARVLSEMGYGGRTDWGMVGLAAWVFFAGKHVSVGRALALWLPSLIVAAVVLALVFGLGGGRK